MEKDKQLWRAKKTQSTFRGEVLQAGERKLDEELLVFCGDLVAQAKQCNEIKPDLNNRFFAELFVAVLTGTGHSWVVSGQKFDLKRVTRQRVEFIIRAALT